MSADPENEMTFVEKVAAAAEKEGGAVCFDAVEYANSDLADGVAIGVLTIVADERSVALIAKWGDRPPSGIMVSHDDFARLIGSIVTPPG